MPPIETSVTCDMCGKTVHWRTGDPAVSCGCVPGHDASITSDGWSGLTGTTEMTLTQPMVVSPPKDDDG